MVDRRETGPLRGRETVCVAGNHEFYNSEMKGNLAAGAEQADQVGIHLLHIAITPETVAKAYGLQLSDVSSFFELEMANAIKNTIRRPRAQGSAGEGAMYGCLQHAH